MSKLDINQIAEIIQLLESGKRIKWSKKYTSSIPVVRVEGEIVQSKPIQLKCVLNSQKSTYELDELMDDVYQLSVVDYEIKELEIEYLYADYLGDKMLVYAVLKNGIRVKYDINLLEANLYYDGEYNERLIEAIAFFYKEESDKTPRLIHKILIPGDILNYTDWIIKNISDIDSDLFAIIQFPDTRIFSPIYLSKTRRLNHKINS